VRRGLRKTSIDRFIRFAVSLRQDERWVYDMTLALFEGPVE